MQVSSLEVSSHQYSLNIPASEKLETAFLEEMLKYVFPDTDSSEFSGGIGEQQFKSFLIQEYAHSVSQKFNLGLRVKGDFHAQ